MNIMRILCAALALCLMVAALPGALAETAEANVAEMVFTEAQVESMVTRALDAKNSGKTASAFTNYSSDNCGRFAYGYSLNGSSLGVTISPFGYFYQGVMQLIKMNAGTFYIACSDFHKDYEQAFYNEYHAYCPSGVENVVIADSSFTPKRGDIALMGWKPNTGDHVVIMTAPNRCVYASGNTLYHSYMSETSSVFGSSKPYGQGVFGYFRFRTQGSRAEVNFTRFYSQPTPSTCFLLFDFVSMLNGSLTTPTSFGFRVYNPSGALVRDYSRSGSEVQAESGHFTGAFGFDLLTGLSPNTTYTWKGYVVMNGQTFESSVNSFTTKADGIVVEESRMYSSCIIGDTFALLRGEISGTVNPPLTAPTRKGYIVYDSSMREIGRMSVSYNFAVNPDDKDTTFHEVTPYLLNTADFGITLKPSTRYFVAPYTVMGGKNIDGVPESFTTVASFIPPVGDGAIPNNAYRGSGASVIRIPDGVKSIGSKAFADCKNLKCVVIPDSVTSISSDAFDGLSAYTILSVFCSKNSTAFNFAKSKKWYRYYPGVTLNIDYGYNDLDFY